MPFNLLKKYNDLLEIDSLNEQERTISLRGVFNKDIVPGLSFKNKTVHPTTSDTEDKMDRLFRHLTTIVVDKTTNKREFHKSRSVRIHWIKYHIEENKKDNMLVFSVDEPKGVRTYIYDIDEKYVIVLEPQRNGESYYLLSAYPIEGRDEERDKMMRKYKRKLDDIL